MDQHIEQLGACPEAEKDKQGIRDITRRRGFWFAAKNRFRQCKVSHVDLPRYNSVLIRVLRGEFDR